MIAMAGHQAASDCAGYFCTDIGGTVQIAFWLTAGVLAVLTYLQARRSLFQPLRVEIFKLQTALLAKVSDMFALKREVDLRGYFDFDEILRLNALLMVERYASLSFDAHPAEGMDVFSKHKSSLVGAMVHARDAEEVFELESPPEPIRPDETSTQHSTSPSWSEYKHQVIHYTKRYSEAIEGVEAVLRDPLLPAGLRPLLERLLKAVHRDLEGVGRACEAAARQMPASYPSLETLQNSRFSWVGNIWNQDATDLEPIAVEIVEFARTYFQVDRAGFSPSRMRRRQSVPDGGER